MIAEPTEASRMLRAASGRSSRRRQARADRSGFAAILVLDAVGLALVAWAFSMHAHGIRVDALFWSGLFLILSPAAAMLLRRNLSGRWTLAILAQLTAALYGIKILRFPQRLGLDDEFNHLLQLRHVVAGGSPFAANWLQPIIAHYPGLVGITAALVKTTHVSLFAGAMIVIGAAKIMGVLSMYLLARRVVADRHRAVLATLLFVAAPTFLYFDSQYAYESLGVPFALLALALGFKIATDKSPRWWLWAAFLFATSATVVTHHLSGLFLASTLVVAALFALATKAPSRQRLEIVASSSVALLVLWSVAFANPVFAYLNGATANPLFRFLTGQGGTRAPFQSQTIASPPYEQAFAIVFQLVLVGLVAYALLLAFRNWKSCREASWVASVGVLYVVSLGARLIPGLQEAGNRFAGLSMIWMALFLAVYLPLPTLWTTSSRFAISVAVFGIAASGFIIGNAYYQRYPLDFLVGSAEQADHFERTAATWATNHIPQGTRITSDRIFGKVLAAYAGLHPVSNVSASSGRAAPILFPTKVTTNVLKYLRTDKVSYIAIDTRITSAPPADGELVEGGEPSLKKPLPKESVEKFGKDPRRLHLVYPVGPIRIYRVARL